MRASYPDAVHAHPVLRSNILAEPFGAPVEFFTDENRGHRRQTSAMTERLTPERPSSLRGTLFITEKSKSLKTTNLLASFGNSAITNRDVHLDLEGTPWRPTCRRRA
jgi:hypothetical protein